MKSYLIIVLAMMVGCSVSSGQETHCIETGSGGSDAGVDSGSKWCVHQMHASMVEDATHQCVFESCELLWGNCDNDVSNGCETPLSMDGACGSCGVVCQDGKQCVTTCDQPGTTCSTGCK